MARSKMPVNSQMGSRIPSMTGTKGVYDHNPNPPFTHPRAMGGGAIPTKFADSGVSKAPKPSDGMLPSTRKVKDRVRE